MDHAVSSGVGCSTSKACKILRSSLGLDAHCLISQSAVNSTPHCSGQLKSPALDITTRSITPAQEKKKGEIMAGEQLKLSALDTITTATEEEGW